MPSDLVHPTERNGSTVTLTSFRDRSDGVFEVPISQRFRCLGFYGQNQGLGMRTVEPQSRAAEKAQMPWSCLLALAL